jgi:hypothetical protein
LNVETLQLINQSASKVQYPARFNLEEYSDRFVGLKKQENVRKSFSVFSNGYSVKKYRASNSKQAARKSEQKAQDEETTPKIVVSNFDDYIKGRTESVDAISKNSGK